MRGTDAQPLQALTLTFTRCWAMMIVAIALLTHALTGHTQNSLADALKQQTEFLPVEQAYQLEGELTPAGDLRLYWQITAGYYLYQHAFNVRVASPYQSEPLEIAYPPALNKTDEFFGEVQVYYDHADLTVPLPSGEDALTVAVTYQGCADAGLCYPPTTQYLIVNGSSGTVSTTTLVTMPPVEDAPVASSPAGMTLLLALGLAFLGGVILNTMPCVFPILSLKVLSFATGDPATHRRHGLAYLLGVVSSFLLIASLLISLQAAGRWVGWGFQLQSTGLCHCAGLSLCRHGVIALGTRVISAEDG
jgi:thiol:disulfide interchange protein DsbD